MAAPPSIPEKHKFRTLILDQEKLDQFMSEIAGKINQEYERTTITLADPFHFHPTPQESVFCTLSTPLQFSARPEEFSYDEAGKRHLTVGKVLPDLEGLTQSHPDLDIARAIPVAASLVEVQNHSNLDIGIHHNLVWKPTTASRSFVNALDQDGYHAIIPANSKEESSREFISKKLSEARLGLLAPLGDGVTRESLLRGCLAIDPSTLARGTEYYGIRETLYLVPDSIHLSFLLEEPEYKKSFFDRFPYDPVVPLKLKGSDRPTYFIITESLFKALVAEELETLGELTFTKSMTPFSKVEFTFALLNSTPENLPTSETHFLTMVVHWTLFVRPRTKDGDPCSTPLINHPRYCVTLNSQTGVKSLVNRETKQEIPLLPPNVEFTSTRPVASAVDSMDVDARS